VAVSALDASTAQVLRAKIEALAGVERVAVDEAAMRILIHCDPECSPASLRPDVDKALAAAGLEPEAATITLLTDLSARRRVKFVGVERVVEHERVRIRVSLEWDGETKVGEAVGENGELIELRTSAAATLDALDKVLGENLGVRLAGVKQLRAFDAELMVIALYRSNGQPQRLVGSVTVGNDSRRAAAVAVLAALNRVLGNRLATA
jgi:hypothetical protein